ncbi:MAG: hypothetical protein KBD23_04045 [Gammaproteobacteria bacterium]|nr:hypothetical protein [Gammaproteobacteria bacterium]MBP9729294.1 hypothetical protein [Gammaproteobacteria bacterium]
MQTEPGKKDPAEDQKKQSNKQKLIDNLLNQIKILNDMLTSRSIALQIINIAKRLSSKDYQRKLKELILEKIRRRRRGQSRVDPVSEELIVRRKIAEESLVTMILEKEKTSSMLPKPAERKPEEKPKTLMFSKMASFFKKTISTKPKPGGSKRSKVRR